MVAAEGELVVSAHLLRGQWTPWCPEDPPGDGTNYVCKLGSLSVFMITIVRHDDFGAATLASAAPLTAPAGANTDKMRLFLLQAGAGRIHGLLQGHGRAGLVALRAAIRELSPAQHLLFRQMVLSMSSGRLPTKDERELVQSLAVALRARLK